MKIPKRVLFLFVLVPQLVLPVFARIPIKHFSRGTIPLRSAFVTSLTIMPYMKRLCPMVSLLVGGSYWWQFYYNSTVHKQDKKASEEKKQPKQNIRALVYALENFDTSLSRQIVAELCQLSLSCDDLADLLVRSGQYEFTLLHEAVHYANHELLALLLTHGGDPNVADQDGWGPLHWAYVMDDQKSIKLLKGAEAADDILTAEGKTPVQLHEDVEALTTKFASFWTCASIGARYAKSVESAFEYVCNEIIPEYIYLADKAKQAVTMHPLECVLNQLDIRQDYARSAVKNILTSRVDFVDDTSNDCKQDQL